MDAAQLDSSLARFYAEARKKDGTEYGRSALLSFRYSMERYLNNPPLNRGISINSDATFSKSNKMLNSVLRNLRHLGKEKVQHKTVITENDLQKLQESGVFNTQEPLGLLRATWFHVTLHFCRRGQEGQRELSPDSFTQETDDCSRKYYVMAHEEVTKNHQGGIQSDENYESDKRMYENDANGGFKYLMLYLSKINKDIPALFQYPKKNFLSNDTIWYDRKPLGVNKLSRMMKEISKAAGLSKVYTNHCLRATAITLLSEAKVPNRHIMAISGHRSEASLASSNNRPSQSQLYNCSNVIAAAASGKSKRLELVGTSGQQPEAFSHTHSINASVPFPQGFQGCNIGTINFVYNLPEQ